MPSFIDELVQRALAEAKARGELDNLPGMVQPLDPSTLSADLFARTLAESGAVHPIAAMGRRLKELRQQLSEVPDPDVRRTIEKEIADLQTRQAIEMEQLRRFG